MSEHNTVHVSGISSGTTDKEVKDFFSFCGKITSISVTPVSGEQDASKSATVTFEKEAAAKTALLLDQTQLGPSTVHVTAAHTLDDIAGDHAASAGAAKDENDQDLEQEDKPKSRIIAEYLAQGYVVSDNAIQKAITLDKKHGFSSRFTSALSNFDQKYHATDRAKGIDESYKITDKAASGWRGLHSYFEKALDTPSGRKIRDFYAQTDKQVRDIHTEARRLADMKGGKQTSDDVPAAAGAEAADVAPSTAPTSQPAGAAPPAEPKA
ncbi:putative actin cytoskeleton protein (VIP1) [Aspergillus clavatus NRRL 1]|uniref:Actin cytoskeleton protein (VIP1), putative n=1 Tax=Aspergillus clavatus (strain ATCC 1007 / CBS 513.65 / DSM 816 / NCTC 3887 / NRRL 1 / QM 1276 / 107) TaxID=344612 RepID=A1C658_ASPCL|nr:actin cytoskeleton protein (VIP1), putative [Aspergillus clavatus NRRL 1]EAW13879.1 actin cytoskeleton protein (VIP1), putative [Aspergillus clavatus NRRL 1]